MITGGASGIGREIARRFVADGMRVVLGDLNEAMLAEAATELGDACATERCDVTEEADVERLVARAVDCGGIDVGVNCAGLGTLGPVTTLSVEQWDLVLDVCLKGVFLSVKHEAAAMQAAGTSGVIVNIASINARQPAQGMAAYCSAKAGVEMLTRVAALELGPVGIRVVGIGPGLVDTGEAPARRGQRHRSRFRRVRRGEPAERRIRPCRTSAPAGIMAAWRSPIAAASPAGGTPRRSAARRSSGSGTRSRSGR